MGEKNTRRCPDKKAGPGNPMPEMRARRSEGADQRGLPHSVVSVILGDPLDPIHWIGNLRVSPREIKPYPTSASK